MKKNSALLYPLLALAVLTGCGSTGGLVSNVYAFLSRQDYLNSNAGGYRPVTDCLSPA